MKEKEYHPSRELFSKCVKAGSRFYYIDAKQDQQGSNYLVISESRINTKTGQRERQRVFVYEEDIEKFVHGLKEVIVALKALPSVGISPMELPDVNQFLTSEPL